MIFAFLVWYAKCALIYRLEQEDEHIPLFTYKQLKKLVLSGNISLSNWDESICFTESDNTKYSWIGTYSYFDFLRLYILQETRRIKTEKSKPKEKDEEKEQLLRKMQDILNQKNEKS